MDTLEAFSKLVGLWPKSFIPRETWRPLVLEELDSWTHDERAQVISHITASMSGARSIDLKTLKAAKAKSVKPKASVASGSEETILRDLGLSEIFKSQHPGDKVMISRLIRSVMHNPGWESVIAEQAGSASEFKDWERIENLLRAADKAMTPTSEGKGRKVCYPHEASGWEAPKGPMHVVMPMPRKRRDWNQDREGLKRISEIGAKHGGFQLGNFTEISNSPEYRAYLEDYTARTGLQPA